MLSLQVLILLRLNQSKVMETKAVDPPVSVEPLALDFADNPGMGLRTQNLLPLLFPGLSGGQKAAPLENKNILVLHLDQPILEQVMDNPLAELMETPWLGQVGGMGLLALLETLATAKDDPKINGLLLHFGGMSAGFASLEEIRQALLEFKASGKFIYAYGEYYNEADYFLASVAEKIFLNPVGTLEWNGLVSEYVFLKGMMDKFGLKAEVFKVGEYKSAVEPFLQEEMSPASRAQTDTLLQNIFSHLLEKISQSRQLDANELRQIADEYLVRSPEDALKYDLITDIAYFDQVEAALAEKIKLEKNETYSQVSLRRYQKLNPPLKNKPKGNQIAVLVAQGEIGGGGGDFPNQIAAETFIKNLRELRQDPEIKAIVLRINSPGGSALASDVMWREIQLTTKVKPVVASMSDVAASGGYYLAMACNKIVAHPTTITGSIGIFGILFNTEELMVQKLGITTDRVKTSPYADIGSPSRPFTEEEREIIQASVENGYRAFTRKAAQGRKMSVEKLKTLAEGRVWSGKLARQNALVDTLGGLQTALREAAALAKIQEYEWVLQPEQENFFKKIFQGADSQVLAETLLQIRLPQSYWWLLRYVQKPGDRLFARLPYELRFR
ncbi:MAG: signal peptide peptidase SppA [Microscillaceae bacterium]